MEYWIAFRPEMVFAGISTFADSNRYMAEMETK